MYFFFKLTGTTSIENFTINVRVDRSEQSFQCILWITCRKEKPWKRAPQP